MIRGLPYDAEVEYLESTGTQYVNTGVILDSTYGIDINFAPMESSGGVSEHGIFGSSWSGSGSVHNVLQIHQSANGVGLWMPSSTRVATAPITVGTIQRWQININNSDDIIIDGVDKGNTHPTTASACPYPVYLFARDVGGALKSGSCSKMRLYSWTVTDANGNIIQQLIPVRVGTTGELYDRVSGKFMERHGDLVVGSDKSVPVMGLHRYPSPSGGIALGKVGVGATMLKQGKTARDYVQDGLVAMWDGIENTGWGTHNSAATIWKDLIGNRDWTLGASTSYEWTANSFDAKDQFAATQDFIDSSVAESLEICCTTKNTTDPTANIAWILLGRSWVTNGPYFGLLYRHQLTSMMACRGYYAYTYPAVKGLKTSFSFPSFNASSNAVAYFNGSASSTDYYNTLDYNATTRGTVARIGGILSQAMPIEVYNIRLYSRALTAAEIAANYAIDKERFNLP